MKNQKKTLRVAGVRPAPFLLGPSRLPRAPPPHREGAVTRTVADRAAVVKILNEAPPPRSCASSASDYHYMAADPPGGRGVP
jgi:hypothetical protein